MTTVSRVNWIGRWAQWSVAPLLLALVASPANAHSFTLDQFNDSATPDAVFIDQTIGQEFAPTLTSLDVVELLIMDAMPNDGLGATVTVNIRADSISGPLLGSSTLVLPDVYGGGTFAVTHFDFPTIVPLTVGNLFVIELVSPGGLFTVAVNPSDTYSAGDFIVHGNNVSGADMVFREGPSSSVPEPSTMLLIGMGAAIATVSRRGRSRTRAACD